MRDEPQITAAEETFRHFLTLLRIISFCTNIFPCFFLVYEFLFFSRLSFSLPLTLVAESLRSFDERDDEWGGGILPGLPNVYYKMLRKNHAFVLEISILIWTARVKRKPVKPGKKWRMI